MTLIGIIGIDVVFAVALLLAASCLGYLVYVTIRGRSELRSSPATDRAVLEVARTGGKPLKSLRPSAVRHHHVSPTS